MITIKIDGLDAVRAQLGSLAKQANYAASRALNTTAFAVNAELKKQMTATFAGGATAYTLRAFKVEKATKSSLVAAVALRTDGPSDAAGKAGTIYNKALAHLFTGGQRRFKKVEGLLRKRNLVPAGMTIAPGSAMRLDRFGNMNKAQLNELLTMLLARPSNMRVYRRTAAGKPTKAVDYFVVQPGAKTRLHPGIYKRVETGKTSAVDPMILYVRPTSYRRFIDLETLGRRVAGQTFNAAFNKELAGALASAKP